MFLLWWNSAIRSFHMMLNCKYNSSKSTLHFFIIDFALIQHIKMRIFFLLKLPPHQHINHDCWKNCETDLGNVIDGHLLNHKNQLPSTGEKIIILTLRDKVQVRVVSLRECTITRTGMPSTFTLERSCSCLHMQILRIAPCSINYFWSYITKVVHVHGSGCYLLGSSWLGYIYFLVHGLKM